jgi:hypothetical protein
MDKFATDFGNSVCVVMYWRNRLTLIATLALALITPVQAGKFVQPRFGPQSVAFVAAVLGYGT